MLNESPGNNAAHNSMRNCLLYVDTKHYKNCK